MSIAAAWRSRVRGVRDTGNGHCMARPPARRRPAREDVMGCCDARQTVADDDAHAAPAGAGASTRRAMDDDALERRLSRALERRATPTIVARAQAANAKDNWKTAKTKLRVVRRMTTTTSARMSELLLEKSELERASSSEKKRRLEEGVKALDVRLDECSMARVKMEGDGNCQFRALAWNVYKDAEQYSVVRRLATEHIEKRRGEFEIYFDSPQAFDKWLREMKRDRTWGDELTLRAACDVLGMKIHVVQSTAANWYLVYEPEVKQTKRMVFISYISPVHYDAITEK